MFGEGPVGARLMLVGEQPGDQEDLAGWPFDRFPPPRHLVERREAPELPFAHGQRGRVTIHPSAILRVQAYAGLVKDLKSLAKSAQERG